MRQLEEQRAVRAPRGNASRELRQIASKALVDVELESLTLFKLLKTFERLMRESEKESKHVVHTIMRYNYTIAEQQEYIFSLLKLSKRIDFKAIFKKLENRIHAIVTFLAVLELLNLQQIEITQGSGVNNFWVSMSV